MSLNNMIKFIISDDRAILPKKAHTTDIGYDLTAIDIFRLHGSKTTLFETGIAVCPPAGYYIEIVPRSSMSNTGYMLANSIGIVDPDYTGTLSSTVIFLENNIILYKEITVECKCIPTKHINLEKLNN